MGSFELKNMSKFNIFEPTDQTGTKHEISNIDIKNLHHYKHHPFKIYTGERFNDMVESIKNNGIFFPIIVRPVENSEFYYEILSGHNRFESAKILGFETIPCIIKEDLSDEEAHLIVTESNLIQRSFSDLSHSERATTLATHYDAIKKQGKRNDMILEIENLLSNANKPYEIKENETSSPVATKSRSDEKIGQRYGLSKDTVVRYIRIDKLIKGFKDLLDDNSLSVRAGVLLSYLANDEQNLLYEYISENELTIDIKKAELLKQLALDKKFTPDKIHEIFLGKKIKKPNKPKSIQFKRKQLENWFSREETQEEIENTILQALDFYFEHKDEYELKSTEEVQNNFELDIE